MKVYIINETEINIEPECNAELYFLRRFEQAEIKILKPAPFGINIEKLQIKIKE